MNNLISERGEIRNQETYNIIESRLGYPMNSAQREAIERLLDSDHQALISVPMARRAGKTSLANGLMRCIHDAITVVGTYNMEQLYSRDFHNRMYSGTPGLGGISPSLIILDEVQDLGYIESLRQRMSSSRILHLYTPQSASLWPEFNVPSLVSRSTEGRELPVDDQRYRINNYGSFEMPDLNTEETIRRQTVIREREVRLPRTRGSMEHYNPLDPFLHEWAHEINNGLKKNKEWDDEENK